MQHIQKLLLFLEGTIMDDRAILYLKVTRHEAGYVRRLGESVPVEGAVDFAKGVAERFDLVYHGARGEDEHGMYTAWLEKHEFPKGEIVMGGYKVKKLPAGIAFAIDDRVQDAEDYYPKFGIPFIPVNQYCARWEKVLRKLEVGS